LREINTTDTEWKVIKRCMEGDHNSFRVLYDTCKDRVFSTSVRMIGNIQDAEDVLQDIFIKVYKKIKFFRCECSFRTWIYKITVNTCIEHLRKRKKHSKNVAIESYTDELSTSSENKRPQDFRLIIENEIETLPEGYKKGFILHAIEGFKHREIAEILDISQGSSKSQFFQAKSLLRKNCFLIWRF